MSTFVVAGNNVVYTDNAGRQSSFPIQSTFIYADQSDEDFLILDNEIGYDEKEVIRVYFPDVTAPIVASRDALILELATNFFNVPGGGGGGDATAANQLLQIAEETAIKNNTAKLDVLLSTRASEGTLDAVKTATEATRTATESNLVNTAKLDVNLSTRASEATLALIKAKTDNLDITLSTLETTLNNIETNTAASGSAIRGNTSAITTVANSATSVVLKAANAGRISITIVNRSNQSLAVAFAATATTTAFTYWLPKRGGDEYSQLTINEYTGVISGIWDSSGDQGASITEVTQV